MPESGVPRNDEPVPESSFGRLNYFFGAAAHLLSKNPRLLVFLGLDAAVNAALFWTVGEAGPEEVGAEQVVEASALAFGFAGMAVQMSLFHVLQCSLMVATMAAARGDVLGVGHAIRTAGTRIVPLLVLALLTTVFTFVAFVDPTGSSDAGSAGLGGFPAFIVWLGWFAIDLMAVAVVAETRGSLMGYLVGAGRLIRRVWGDSLLLVLFFLLTTNILLPVLVTGIASGIAGADPSREVLIAYLSVSVIARDLVLTFIFVWGARLYLFAVAAARVV